MADVKGMIQRLFPFISAAASLGGPLGTLAANAVGKAMGVDKVDSTASGITTAINGATPDQILALQKAEQDFQIQMAQMGFENLQQLEQIAQADRADARAREISVKDWTPRILGYGVVSAFIGVVIYVLSGKASVETVLAGTLIGYMSAKAELVLTYYFGSSAGSDEKTKILADQAKDQQQQLAK